MRALLPLCMILTTCANDLPDAQRTLSPRAQAAPYPELAPTSPLLARADARQTRDVAAALTDRRAALEARAEALRSQAVIDPNTRARLERATR